MILGSHVSCQGGVAKAAGRAINVGADCLQVFVNHPPRQWPVKAVKPHEEPPAKYKLVHCKTVPNKPSQGN